MKKQNILIGVVASTLLLSGCGFLNNDNNEKPKQSNTQSANQNDKSSKQKKQGNESENNQTEQSKASQQNENKGYIYPKNTKEYYAQIWLSVRDDIESFDKLSITYDAYDSSGEPVNYNNADASAIYPEGVVRLMSTPTAGGSITFKDNNDGTITVYGVPSKFQDLQWIEDDNYSLRETQKMMNSGQRIAIKNSSESDIAYVASRFLNSTPISSGKTTANSESSSSSSSTTVTRSNVIDLVEDYEGHLLDTSTYTFKEPEQMPDGRWGFSILDKAGNLVGSYIIDPDGTVTKYDEKGQPI
ncbi:hypothetical protein TP70_03595 [Staphylococcus microti]|uniref:Lipoprotein n=1 Tax=Staphylococcus microti TaxID=569857 RepID=A0A0D6XQV9_9STAP|nr:hypothetical protein [Staphylococcus microti]KIX91199.1 hypothetical protein TP70_03595 [Staphylococcus microti]PNZ80128.1 hypothetical protein CD132_08435 [Staphylococcus microti]SUM56448.1 lipoprotein [Staphylococcus microti]